MSARPTTKMTVIALMLVFAASTVSAQTYWFETYESAVDKIEDQDQEEMEEALEILGELVAERPLPQSNLRVPGDRRVDYLPYFQKARIQMMLGQYDEARQSLDASEAFQAVLGNRQAMAELKEMRGALNQRAATTP